MREAAPAADIVPVLCRSNSHNWNFKPGFYAITERFEPANGAVMPEGQAFVEKIALYHYVVKCVSALACVGAEVRVRDSLEAEAVSC